VWADDDEGCRDMGGGGTEGGRMGRGGGFLRDVLNSIGRGRFRGTASALFRNLWDAEVSSEIFF
jgi:hypothetical protein